MKKKPQKHQVTKSDFPIKTIMRTYNFGDLLRYFKYYMGAGLISATVERRVQRELINRGGVPKYVFAFIGVGIMCFLILMGAYILMNSPSIVNAGSSTAAASGGLVG